MNGKFTSVEHEETGACLRSARNELVELGIKLINSGYDEELVDVLDEALKCIDSVRSKLDDQVCKEYTELDDKTVLNIYY
jgi:hypothetical protein